MQKPFETITWQQLPEILAAPAAVLLDCRKLADYRAGHVDGALHVHDSLVESLLACGDHARPLAIYCYHGHTSEHLAEAFGNAGFVNVFSVAGGYEARAKQ